MENIVVKKLLRNSIFDIDTSNYFEKYVLAVNNNKDCNTYRFGKRELTDLVFINFISLMYELDVSFETKELLLLSNVNKFEAWLLHPNKFNYKEFDVLWLNGCDGSLLFCMWTVRKPADIFDVIEINGASEPEALQLSIPLSSRLKNILLSSEEGILDFSGRRTS